MVSSNNVTITKHGGSLRLVSNHGSRIASSEIPPATVAALRAHFAAERMPEDAQALVDELHGVTVAFGDMSPIGNLARRARRALEAAYPQKGVE